MKGGKEPRMKEGQRSWGGFGRGSILSSIDRRKKGVGTGSISGRDKKKTGNVRKEKKVTFPCLAI